MSTNYAPTTKQLSVTFGNAESAIATKRSELQVIWDEICTCGPGSSTDGRTSRLNQLIEELRSIDRGQPPTYINMLPSELLCVVFEFIVSLLPFDLVEQNTFKPQNTWLGAIGLSVVCKRWQAIMLSSPWLWGTLIIDSESFDPELLRLHLHLSHSYPLTLYLITPNEEALLALKPHAHRIQHLYCFPFAHCEWHLEILHDGAAMALDHPWLDTKLDAKLSIPTSIVSLVATLQKSPVESIFHLRNLQYLIIRDKESNLQSMSAYLAFAFLSLIISVVTILQVY